MILAAGLGVRMRPLTDLRPKPALPVLNRPLIAHVLDHLAMHGVERAVINTHHLPDMLEEATGKWKPASMEVVFSHEPEILGTAGGLRKAAKHFRDEPFYLINSDSVSDVDLGAVADAHAASGRRATLVVRSHDPASGYRPLEVSAGGRIAGLAGRRWGGGGKPRTFIGVHVMNPEVLDAIAGRGACDINADVYPAMLDEDAESVGTWEHSGWWFEAGTPARYLELNIEMLERSGNTAVVGPGFFVDDEARIGRSVVGSRARVERNASVIDSVVWRHVSVSPGASIRGCIVTNDVELPAGGTYEESIIRAGADGSPSVVPLRPAS